jgi:hypothetical protein
MMFSSWPALQMGMEEERNKSLIDMICLMLQCWGNIFLCRVVGIVGGVQHGRETEQSEAA